VTRIRPALRDARWLGRDRAVAWSAVLALVFGATLLVLAVTTQGGTGPDPWGRPLGTDFSSFWTASRLALAGDPAAAWDPVRHAAAQRASFPPADGYAGDYYAFFYPPIFLLTLLPFGAVPYGVALAGWVGLSSTLQLAVLRASLPRSWPAILAGLAFPGLLLNATHGQNGALSAALLGSAALQLDRRPRLAGVCLGLLSFKPQLALLVVPALVAARRWRALAWAAATSGLLCIASALVLGPQSWRAFLANAYLARAALESGGVGFGKMASPFAALRLAGAGLEAAWIGQGIMSLGALAVLISVSRTRPGAAAEIAALAAAACLATPFLLDYDLMLLAVPLAWVASLATTNGFRPWEKLLLAGAFLLPLVARPLALSTGLQVAPVVVAVLLAVVVRRCRSISR
jgi:alpha-1,2-mannosyltransferase